MWITSVDNFNWLKVQLSMANANTCSTNTCSSGWGIGLDWMGDKLLMSKLLMSSIGDSHLSTISTLRESRIT